MLMDGSLPVDLDTVTVPLQNRLFLSTHEVAECVR
jgi:hypothetical protein